MRLGLLLSFLAAILLVCGGCSPEKKREVRSEPVPVKIVRPEPGVRRATLRMIARLKPWREVALVSRVSGFLVERNFVEGAAVPAGSVLYRIEEKPYRLVRDSASAALDRARAEALNARIELDRAEKLLTEDAAARKRFDSARAADAAARAEVRSAEAELAQTELNLSYTAIVAPFAGRVGYTNYDVGSYLAAPSGTLAVLSDASRMRVQFEVSDRYLSGELLSDLAAGKMARWSVKLRLPDGSAYPGKGQVEFSDNRVDPESATLAIQAIFDNSQGMLLPGLYGKIELTSPSSLPVLSLDGRAVSVEQGGYFVYWIDPENRARYRRIEGEFCENDRFAVESGLVAADRIALPGNPMLRPGSIVTEPSEAR